VQFQELHKVLFFHGFFDDDWAQAVGANMHTYATSDAGNRFSVFQAFE